MLNARNPANFSETVKIDVRNKRLIINGYAPGITPLKFARHLIELAQENKLEKIWLWALPADVPEFLQCGFRTEGNLFQGKYEEFVVSLAYFLSQARSVSSKLQLESDIIQAVKTELVSQSPSLPPEIKLKILNTSFAPQISQLLTQVFVSYPSPIEDPQYICSLIQQGNIFAGAFSDGQLIGVAAAYPELTLNRCEMTDCATAEEFRGHSLSEYLLRILEQEIHERSPFTLYTLARARSYGMNRVFHKLGYRYSGRLINNCHIAGSFEDMNLWVK